MFKALDKWLSPYARSVVARPRPAPDEPVDILVAVCDHFEPLSPGGNKPHALGVKRVTRWLNDYPAFAENFRDTNGKHPQHSFFFPIEEAHPDFLRPLAELTRQGVGEVEIHLHHRHDTADNLRSTLADFRDVLHHEYGLLGTVAETRDGEDKDGHGAWSVERGAGGAFRLKPAHQQAATNDQRPATHDLSRRSLAKPDSQPAIHDSCAAPYAPSPGPEDSGAFRLKPVHQQVTTDNGQRKTRPVFAFIHGNWALCNARPDGDWCGVDHELSILKETGCYADLTFPAIPSPCQPKRFCNSVYLAKERGRRSHDHGRRARVGVRADADELLMIQGPAALNWAWRKWGLLPRIEHADVSGANPPTPGRADLWVKQHIHVAGQPNWIFVKLHTHGCIERNSDVLLGEAMRQTHARLQTKYNDGITYRLHYVTAREMANIAFAAMAGKTGDPGDYRDFVIAPPPCKTGRGRGAEGVGHQ
ncbi:MAG: hypothetical protein RRC34_09910 [Lentisphaeria bacterium]|nr:hypothetical protein [Lentisphaeria bacterium]